MAQLAEQSLAIQEIIGSNPVFVKALAVENTKNEHYLPVRLNQIRDFFLYILNEE